MASALVQKSCMTKAMESYTTALGMDALLVSAPVKHGWSFLICPRQQSACHVVHEIAVLVGTPNVCDHFVMERSWQWCIVCCVWLHGACVCAEIVQVCV